MGLTLLSLSAFRGLKRVAGVPSYFLDVCQHLQRILVSVSVIDVCVANQHFGKAPSKRLVGVSTFGLSVLSPGWHEYTAKQGMVVFLLVEAQVDRPCEIQAVHLVLC